MASAATHRTRLRLKRVFNPVLMLLVRAGLFRTAVPVRNWAMRRAGIDKVFNAEPDHQLFARMFDGVFNRQPSADSERALFLLMHGAQDPHNLRCLLIASFLQQKGLAPEFVVCDRALNVRSEERRVGKECRSRWRRYR